ncbi:hypothetical protein HDU93_000371 [Gonapodya sp. JEL0774]|nr:hypothetical protein HDU93_000371 [Gonapodya sp. JEL0774]
MAKSKKKGKRPITPPPSNPTASSVESVGTSSPTNSVTPAPSPNSKSPAKNLSNRASILEKVQQFSPFQTNHSATGTDAANLARLLYLYTPSSLPLPYDIRVTPDPLNFGKVIRHSAEPRRSVILTNLGSRSVRITKYFIVHELVGIGGPFSIRKHGGRVEETATEAGNAVAEEIEVDSGSSHFFEVVADTSSEFGTKRGFIVLLIDNEYVCVRECGMVLTSALMATFRFDVFAKVYIPDNVVNLFKQRLVSPVVPAMPPPGPNLAMISSDAIPPGLNITPFSFPIIPTLHPSGKINREFAISKEVTFRNYSTHFRSLLLSEMGTASQRYRSFSLFAVPIEADVKLSSQGVHFVRIKVPGILDNAPRVIPGNVIRLRCLSTWDGFEYQAFVWNVQRRTQEIVVQVSEWTTQRYPVGSRWNVEFVYSEEDITRMMRACDAVTSTASETQEAPARSWLFPDVSDGVRLLRGERRSQRWSLRWHDSDLNLEQRKAVEAIVDNDYGNVPYAIWGPPGTGKTKTIVEAILQVLSCNPNSHILATTPSHSAADTLTLRLKRHLPPSQLLRLVHHSRMFSEIPQEILPFTFTDPTNRFFSVPTVHRLLEYRIVVCTCQDASILIDLGVSNTTLEEVWTGHHVNLRERYPHLHRSEAPPWEAHWTHLFVDEAGQALEPEVAIPMSVALVRSSGYDHFEVRHGSDMLSGELVSGKSLISASPNQGPVPVRRQPSQVILSGDFRQLGPIVQSEFSRQNKLGVSLMERVMSRPLYAQHPSARDQISYSGERRNVFDGGGKPSQERGMDFSGTPQDTCISDEMAQIVPPFQNLVKNYRSHPGIIMEPSRLFYSDTLVPAAPLNAVSSLLSWKNLPNPQFPILIYGVQGEDEAVGEGDSWWNEAEVAAVLETVEALLAADSGVKISPGDFAIIAPFREQVRRIRQVLRQKGLAAVNVGGVEDFQGMERRVVILSCVRSRERFTLEDQKRDLGVVINGKWDGRRLNVALTRAKELLVAIGNPALWTADMYWREILHFASRRHLYKGLPLPPQFSYMQYAHIGLLERKFLEATSVELAFTLDPVSEAAADWEVDQNDPLHGIVDEWVSDGL